MSAWGKGTPCGTDGRKGRFCTEDGNAATQPLMPIFLDQRIPKALAQGTPG